ncbi:MAG: hypothetical protein NTY32_12950, partial [Bacteroidia bacterium]|nr:hypothetical protein [Bacteroidia bacterium]
MSGTWIVPEGVRSAIFQVWGGGGAGGSAYSGTATTNTQSRSGGGAGGSFASVSINVTPGQVVNYTVGAGGIGAAQGFIHRSKGEAGGSSFASINNVKIVSALGGLGGENVSLTNLTYSGIGGVAPATGNIGDVLYYGGNGGTGSAGSGGGGGSAGTLGNGGNGSAVTAGSAGSGGGAAGGTGTNLNATAPTAGSFPGGGGAGAVVRNSSPFSYNNVYNEGAAGGNGKIIIFLVAIEQMVNVTADSNLSSYSTTSATDVTVASGVLTVDATASVKSITVAPRGRLTLNNGVALTVGALTLQSNAANGTATFVNNGGTVSATTTSVQQYLGTARNWYVSSPVSNAKAPSGYTYYQR